MIPLLLYLVACDPAAPSPSPSQAEVPQEQLSETTQEGPIEATVAIWPKDLLLGDPLQLKLTVKSEAGVEAALPPFGEAIGRFQISDFRPRSQTRDDGSQEQTQTYTLQAPMSGLQRIPALRIVYTDRRDGQAGEERELLTEELSIQITGLLDKDAPLDFKPAQGTLRPRVDIPIGVWAVGTGLILLTGGWFARKRYLSWQ